DCRRGAGPFSIGASVQSDRIVEALDDIRQELEDIRAGRPPSQSELDDARRSLLEAQPRQFETPSSPVSRYANLQGLGLPHDHEVGFGGRLRQINRDLLLTAARHRLHPDALVVVVVADAARATEQLRRITWAVTEVISDDDAHGP